MKTKGLLICAIASIFSLNSLAQENEKRFGFELSGGVSVAIQKLADADLRPGPGFEGIFHYRIMPHVGTYVGWGWNKFSADQSFAGQKMDFEETGYVFGMQFKHPVGNSPFSYYVRAGGLYNHIEIENQEGDIVHDTGHGFGWQLAGGLDVSLGRKWSFTPGFKFHSLNRELNTEGTTTKLGLNYLSLRIGIMRKF
jgi:hypothetical protein